MKNNNISVKTRMLVSVFSGCLISVFLCIFGLAYHEWEASLTKMSSQMSLGADIIANDIGEPLAVGEFDAVASVLESLPMSEYFDLSCIYDLEGVVVASLGGQNEATIQCPNKSELDSMLSMGEQHFLTREIMYRGATVGTLVILNTSTSIFTLFARNGSEFFIIGVLALLLGMICSWLIYRDVYISIQQLNRVSKKIVENENYSARTSVASDGELGDISSAFNKLLAKIEADNEELTRLSYYDSLTKLANRRMFIERLDFALENARRSGDEFALMLLDIDQFKQVNDELGHDIGDLMLKSTAKRLESLLPANATGFRVGGDEFVVLQTGVSHSESKIVVNSLIDLLSQSQILAGRQVSVSVSIGVALSDGYDNVSSILKRADAALVEAKSSASRLYAISNKNHEQSKPSDV